MWHGRLYVGQPPAARTFGTEKNIVDVVGISTCGNVTAWFVLSVWLLCAVAFQRDQKHAANGCLIRL
jgi:hypothetical protein